MAVAQLLQEHGELGHGLGDLHVGQVALEEDGALGSLGAFVVQRVGGGGCVVAGEVDGGGLFLFGHHRGRHGCSHVVGCCCVLPVDHGRCHGRRVAAEAQVRANVVGALLTKKCRVESPCTCLTIALWIAETGSPPKLRAWHKKGVGTEQLQAQLRGLLFFHRNISDMFQGQNV